MAVRKGSGRGDFQFGSFGSDALYGRGGNDVMFGWFGSDSLYGGRGNDLMFGGYGNDRVFGGRGNDWLFGGQGNDKLGGGSGNDWLFGGSGNDKAFGGSGNDKLYGGSGNDRLNGGSGNDKVYGQSGNDTLVYRADKHSGDDDYYSGGSGRDKLVIRLNAEQAADADIQAEIAEFEEHLENGGGQFTFETLGLTVDGIETLRVRAPKVEPKPEPVNTAPTQSGDVALGASDEDTSFEFTAADLLANASDAEGDVLTVSNVSASAGTLELVEGRYVYTPDANANGDVTFTYDITDGTETISASATLDVTAINDGPTVAAPVDFGASDEDTPFTFTAADLLAGASDVDGDALTVNDVSASAGSVELVDGVYVYTPDADANGAVTFSYSVSDGIASVAGTASLDVTAVNDAPETGRVDLGSSQEDTQVMFSAADLLSAANDVDGDSLDVANVSASSGSVELVDGQYVYTPAADFNGTVTINYVITDGAETIRGSATLDVEAVNDGPVVDGSVDLGETGEDNAMSFTASDLITNASDADGDALIVSDVQASSGSVELVDGAYVFTPDADQSGPVSFTYLVSDGQASVTAMASLDVLAVNDAPVVDGVVDLGGSDEDTPFAFTDADLLAAATDVDGDALSISNVQVSTGSIVLAEDGYVFTPDADANGPVTFTYSVSDGAEVVEATATLDVRAVNDAPTAGDDAVTVSEDDEYVSVFLGGNDTDVDGDAVSVVSIDDAALVGTVTVGDLGEVTYTPPTAAQALGVGETMVETFSYTVSDGALTDTATVTVTVEGANDAPLAQDDGEVLSDDAVENGDAQKLGTSIEAGESIDLNVLANDSDVDTNDTLEITGILADEDLLARANIQIVGEGDDQRIVFQANADFFAFGDGPLPDATAFPDAPVPDGEEIILVGGGGLGVPGGLLGPLPPPGDDNGELVQFEYTVSDGTDTDTATVSLYVFDNGGLDGIF